MQQDLKHVLDNYYETIRAGRPNYRSCYNSFLEYCNKYSEYPLGELVEKIISITDIELACKNYIESSKKAESIEAVRRFLTAIDQFFKYLKKEKILHPRLEDGCRRKEVVHRICASLNDRLKQKIYLPFDEAEGVRIVEEQIQRLNKNNFYQFGQSIIYRLLINYGFKEKIVVNLKFEDFNQEEGTILVNCDRENDFCVRLREDIAQDLRIYCGLHKYQNRSYLFTKSNGKALTPDSMLGTLKERVKKLGVSNFTPTSVALQGIAVLLEKGLTIGEIKILTGFESQKIEDISEYLLTDADVEAVINAKLSKDGKV